jgi:hypothetical protein
MTNTSIKSFLSILETQNDQFQKIELFDTQVELRPLSFKQQKMLVTAGLNGVAGVLSFLKILNDILIDNTGNEDLKVYHKIPLISHLRKAISNTDLIRNEISIKIDDIIKNIKPFDGDHSAVIEGNGFSVNLKIPTLKDENKIISACIEEIKKIAADDVSKNVSLIMSYEFPKFIESITFGSETLIFKELSIQDRSKIIDNLPADITNNITNFISIIRQYEDDIMTVDGITVDIDSSFFE